MKTSILIVIIIVSILVAVLIISQIYASNETRKIESLDYEIVENHKDFEIRKYSQANFSYVTMPEKSYKETSSRGFRTLANYIFGGNESKEKIAMTSPVIMNLEDSTTMQFMIPKKYELDQLPKPNDSKVRFKTEAEKTVAVITFSGWANDEKINFYKDKLIDLLEENQIQYTDKFSFLGYDPPFKIVGRKNEVMVELP